MNGQDTRYLWYLIRPLPFHLPVEEADLGGCAACPSGWPLPREGGIEAVPEAGMGSHVRGKNPAGRRGQMGRHPVGRWLAPLTLALTLACPGSWSRASPLASPGKVITCTLIQVLDGDSMQLRCRGETVEVRLHCIDAPEWEQGPWGRRSLRHLERNTPREVELRAVETDRFGRTVGEIYGTGPGHPLLNLQQVASGQAAVYRHYCDDPRYDRAEREARETRRGIWSQPGEQQTPWTFRHRIPR